LLSLNRQGLSAEGSLKGWVQLAVNFEQFCFEQVVVHPEGYCSKPHGHKIALSKGSMLAPCRLDLRKLDIVILVLAGSSSS
jgi:hypothetical protein